MLSNAIGFKGVSFTKALSIIPFALALLLSFSSAHAATESPRIDELRLETNPALKVSFVVKDAFTGDIETAVKSGIPTSFRFIVELNRVRSAWFDAGVSTREFVHTVKYDTLKEEYEVSLGELGSSSTRTRDLNEMKRLMTTVSGVDIPGKLEPGAEHEVRVMAELKTIRLPFYLDYVLFFVKFLDFETDWYTVTFRP